MANYRGVKRFLGSIAVALVALVAVAPAAGADICILGGEICIDTH